MSHDLAVSGISRIRPKSTRNRSERGSVLLEAAFVLPILLFLVFGIIDFGVAISLKQSVTHSATEGARAAIGAQIGAQDDTPHALYYPHNEQCNAWARTAHDQALSSLGWIGSNASYAVITATVTVNGADCSTTMTTSSPSVLTLSITYPYGAHPIVPDVPGIGIINPTTLSATGVVVVQ